jgi:hypothetical protein
MINQWNYELSFKCNWCGLIIHFEPHIKGNNGRQIPLNADNSIHSCIGSRSFSSKNKTKILY